MKKAKGKMELRYYDIPQNEFLIALQNQNWQNKNQKKSWYILVPVIMIVIVFLAFKLMLNVPLPSGLLI